MPRYGPLACPSFARGTGQFRAQTARPFMSPRTLLGAALSWLFLGLAGCGTTPNQVGPPATPAPAATRTPGTSPVVAGSFTPPPGQIYFGAYVNPSGLTKGNTPAAVASFEGQIGRTLALHTQYLAFTADFTGNLLTDDYVHYRVPVASWNCQYSNAAIASGAYDATLQQAAAQARAFSGPIFIRYLWDANLGATEFQRTSCWDKTTDQPNYVFSGPEYIKAWQHIHDIFTAAGATNVVWLWTISADPDALAAFPYYPGDQYVDWIGMDAYDINSQPDSMAFSSAYDQLLLITKNKPIMISETGALGTLQPTFFSTMVSTLQTQYPLVKAFCYYDAINYNGEDNQDWRIVTAAWPSFISMANNPYMSASYVP